MIKYVFFDFGGCIDAPGVHSRTLFWDAFQSVSGASKAGRAAFQEAYSRADQRMMKTGEAKAMGLVAFNRHNATLIAQDMGVESAERVGKLAGDRVSDQMNSYLRESKRALKSLGGFHPLGIISNFTGNLEVILEEFEMRDLFHSITESFYVGSSKPDPRIFAAALAKQKFSPGETLYVGDNPRNDIEPGKAAGMKTALIHPAGERAECGADFYVEALRDLLPIIHKA